MADYNKQENIKRAEQEALKVLYKRCIEPSGRYKFYKVVFDKFSGIHSTTKQFGERNEIDERGKVTVVKDLPVYDREIVVVPNSSFVAIVKELLNRKLIEPVSYKAHPLDTDKYAIQNKELIEHIMGL